MLDSRIERGLLGIGADEDHPASKLEPTSSKTVDMCMLEYVKNYRAALEISWDEICSLFEGIYLNWDQSLFQYNLEFHGYILHSDSLRSACDILFVLRSQNLAG